MTAPKTPLPKMTHYGMTRRNDLAELTPVEKGLVKVAYAIEALGADEKLTNAVIKVQEARNLLADWLEST